MLGTEASLALGAISSIIKLVNATKQVYDTATNTEGLPEAFREVAGRLPIVINILGSANQCIDEGDVDEDSCQGVKHVIEACEIKARKLNKLFCEVIPADGASGLKRYRKAVKAYGKGNEVENLMKGMLEDVQLLACERGFKTAINVRQVQVSKVIKEVSAVPSSVHGPALQGTGFTADNYGPGTQTNYISQGEYIAPGQAPQYNSMGGDMHSGQTGFYAITQNMSALQGPQEIKACLEALFITNPRDDREDLVQTKGPRVRGTCEWIKTNELYSSWLHSRSQLLWLSGGPGKGKTMISIFVAEELDRTAANTQDTLFLQYFCDNKRDERNTGVAIIKGLLYQLLQLRPKLIEHILPRFEVEKASLFTLEALWGIFEAMIRDITLGTVYCVLDGLDECEESSLLVLLEKLEALFSTDSSSAHCLKLLVVSRDHPEFISEILSNFPCIRLDTYSYREVDADVRHFIKVRVDELADKKKYPTSLRAHVKEVFANRANGTFLWVGIVADQLTKYTWSEVERALKDHFPPGLEELYARMLLQIRGDRRKTAAKILLWVTMTVRPLSLSELSAAIDIEIEPSASFSRDEFMRDKVSHCGYFLTVEEDGVSLIHQSAKDYLTRKTPDSNPELEFFRLKEEVGNIEIARKCFDYLQNGALAGGKVDPYSDSSHLEAFPLLPYATLYWAHHTKFVPRSEHMVNPSHPFYEKKSQTRESWLKAYWAVRMDEIPPELFTPLHLASWFDILPLAKNILSKKGLVDYQKLPFIFHKRHQINKRDSYGRTALWGAAAHGHETLVQLLLEKGAEVKSKGELEDGSKVTAWFYAAILGYIAVLRLLLKNGANVDEEGEVTGKFRGTALSWAVLNGDKDVALLLIENGADLKTKCEIARFRFTMLYAAVWNGHVAVVQLLLEKGLEIDEEIKLEGGPPRTALIIAIQNGNEGIVQLLIESGANVNAKVEVNGTRVTVLYLAAATGNRAIVQLLLENGAEVSEIIEVSGGSPTTALYSAATSGQENMVQLLLEKGADAQAEAQIKGSRVNALIGAALNGHEAVVRVLLKNEESTGVNPERRDASRKIALYVAVGNGQEAVVQLLLTNGVDVNTSVGIENGGRMPMLYLAVIRRNEAMAWLLLKNGADIAAKVEIAAGSTLTALHSAVFNGDEAMVQLLLKNGADIQVTAEMGDGFRVTALYSAAVKGNEAMVRLLLENGADIQAKVAEGTFEGTVLEWAALEEQEPVRRLLLEKGADVTSTGQQPIVEPELHWGYLIE
ncbi:hypothetical protein VE03_09507 [Pseudogymnoascus sp. 23342-1-I1]|nr:hypothetical protein VE03_09507 [Pseudogymnoascus sp. 23342-1-I1]